MRFLTKVSILLLCHFAIAQDYTAATIAEELLQNADAVNRLDKMDVVVTAQDEMTIFSKRVVTVLNEKGNKHVQAYAFYEKNDKITDIEAIVYDAKGKEIKKIKKRDFVDQSAIDGGTLYSDSRVLVLNYTPTQYPYTIEFTKEYFTPNTAFAPFWNFLDDYRVSVEKSEFSFTVDCDINFRYKESNFEQFEIESDISPKSVHYVAENIKAMSREPLSPPFRDFSPQVKIALEKFHLEGVDGTAKTWDELGKWMYDVLLTGQDALDAETIAKVQGLVSDTDNVLEKIKRVYEYVQNNTRYISVQLGIGGWMPISAQEVDRVKYGDCKGLVNYTKALLNAVGITSYYTVVYGGRQIRDLDSEFPSMQGNHVILNVPLEGKDVWLECTSQTTPVDHMGMFTDSRNVLKVTPEGGQLLKTKMTSDEENYQKVDAEYYLDANRNLRGAAKIVSYGTQYDQKYWWTDKSRKEQEEHYHEYWSYLNNLSLGEIDYTNNKEDIEFAEEVQINVDNYLAHANNQFLLAPNVFNRNLLVPDRTRNRTKELLISRGYLDEDKYIIHLPDGYKAESLYTPVKHETKFGTYETSLEEKEKGILVYNRKLLIKSGKYPKEDYDDYRDFRKKVARYDNTKIILTKY